MRYPHLIILLLLMVYAGCKSGEKGKYFTGTIEYAYSYESDSINADSLTRVRPAKGAFRYDLNNYQSRFIGQDTHTFYYSGNLNKCVSENNSRRNYECEDYGVLTDSIVTYKLYDTDEKILGHSCKILEMQKSNSWVKYYVCNELKIAPATYEKHKSYNWDIYGEIANGGLILKSEHRFKKFVMMGTATTINKINSNFTALQLDEKLFSQICK